jgi:hypothetical protein
MGLAILNVRHAALDDVHSRAVFNFDGSTVIRSDN